MANILRANRYELAVARLNRLDLAEAAGPTRDSRAEDARASLREKFSNDAEQWKAIQDKNIVLGGMHRIRYVENKHDPFPLAIIFNEIKTGIKAVPAINLHYLVKNEAFNAVRLLLKFNAPRVGRGLPPAVIWEMVDKFPFQYIPYRLYKIEAIRPIEYIPVADWEETAKTEVNRWQGFRDF